jgi:hypothetical protein
MATNALEKAIRCHPVDSDPSITGREMPSRRIFVKQRRASHRELRGGTMRAADHPLCIPQSLQ